MAIEDPSVSSNGAEVWIDSQDTCLAYFGPRYHQVLDEESSHTGYNGYWPTVHWVLFVQKVKSALNLQINIEKHAPKCVGQRRTA